MWTASELKRATDGRWIHTIPVETITGVSIDTRTLRPGDLYIALQGEHHNGHDFMSQAWQARARAAIVQEGHNYKEESVLLVKDTMQALKDLAVFARKRSKARVLAITGSVGKTTTKTLLAHVLSYIGSVVATAGNLNNHIGVPLSLARLKEEADFGIFELGTNHPGEISPLSLMVKPHTVLVTAVEKAHQLHFPTEEDILYEKMSILDGLNMEQGHVILPRDHRHFALMVEQVKKKGVKELITYGKHPESIVRLEDVHCHKGVATIQVSVNGKCYHYDWYVLGQHNIQASLAALALAHGWDLDKAMICDALSYFRALDGRGRRHWVKWKSGVLIAIDDSYNANPASMQAALKNLIDQPILPHGRHIAVLSDMLELGSNEKEDHERLAPLLNDLVIGKVFACGPLMAACYDRLNHKKQGGWAKTAQDLWPILHKTLQPGDVVLLKGSHSMNLGFILHQLFTEKRPTL